jgi:acetyl-CoA carboxylase carboxyltransferase component
MSWKDDVDEIAERRRLAQALGGEQAVARHHARGRLTVRERIDHLIDAESFREFGQTSGHVEVDEAGRRTSFQPANIVTGVARIDGRAVVIGGDDFTMKGGAYTPASLKKAQHADGLAVQRRIPLVRLLEGGGASISGAYGTRGRSGYDLTVPPPMNVLAMEALASVPVVCAALGPCAGFPAARLAASHFSLMTKETAVVLTGGPALVERALGKSLTKEELGGATVHGKSGVVDNIAADEEDALAQICAFLSYLPSNVWELPPVTACDDSAGREEDALLSVIPRERRRAYKVRKVIGLIVDRGSFFELTPGYGRTQVTGLARVKGRPVGVIANDGMVYGGGMSADGARKIRRFVELCDAFNLPVVSFVDEPGFQIGPDAERAGTIRAGMEAMFAVLQTQVPWIAFVMRKSFGVAQGIHFGPGCTVLAWPSMQSGALPVESGVQLAFGKEIAEAEDPEARRRELEEEMFAAQSVYPRAEDFGVHDLIDPRKSRPLLCDWIDEVEGQLRQGTGPRAYAMRP